jgi:predicted RNA-binding protein associated with RNAse of E/G family
MADDIIVIKKNIEGQETWRYSGHVLERHADWLRLEATYNRLDTPFHGILIANGDRFVETYYTDRWYNIFEMHDRLTDELKGWYCNVTEPPIIESDRISYIDLALDLLVYPDKSMLVLDEDEFVQLHLDDETTRQARSAIDELKQHFKT